MDKQPASIFNDVIGPVMRGPSSSHVAAAARIGKLGRQMVKGNLKEVIVEFDPKGSLATTYHGHGSDMGLVGGLLDYEPQDSRLTNSVAIAREEGLDVSFHVVDYEADHPNTYKMTLISDRGEKVQTTSISTGGGMIQYEDIEGFEVNIAGDFYESLIFIKDSMCADEIVKYIENKEYEIDYINKSLKDEKVLINIKGAKPLSNKIVEEIEGKEEVLNVMSLSPVLPIMSRKNCEVPFINAEEMLKVGKEKNLKLWELAVLYESARGNISEEEVFEKMKEIVTLMDQSIESGLKGTDYEDRILGPQSHKIEETQRAGKLVPGNVLNRVISSITSMMEVKSSMGVIVAAPTAGSCGGLPGTIIGATRELGLSIEDATRAMLAAGIIGLFIAEHATFAAEVGGCQVECGAGSGMAAGGLVELMAGSATEGVDAASIALQNIMGMVCDPVADRVEVPCLGKNVMAGANAIACANMALAGFDKVIPLDETIESMYKVGHMLPSELRCTGYGGLSITKTAQRIYKDMN
ncbi:L-serine ammonia-lyase, iron-sulfur-dependent, subunit alpha [Anaeromicrobium sediminis]|uniref:L-serine dehydratase n=1 Tax=Anaeromicrobium sediminis TaxID=1478221 RepID=A0A267MMT9_9FIRM|nr:L-serine ammonia-lyase, iron-sulfur-dependent, subunit alpha [Anaeromicrobium sediminis]PAB60185.1 L-serine ammonia-lyase, iron-sulfur-dependent, subunit alpha [Anaeromicrobium sediminis]